MPISHSERASQILSAVVLWPNATTSIGSGNFPRVFTVLAASAMTTQDFEASQTSFSRSRAAPPPLISDKPGPISSAPATVGSIGRGSARAPRGRRRPRRRPASGRRRRSFPGRLLLRHLLAELRRPAFLLRLLAPPDGQGVGLHVLGDHRARARVGARPDPDRRHQRRARADERAFAYVGVVFEEAVVVAEDRPGADVR